MVFKKDKEEKTMTDNKNIYATMEQNRKEYIKEEDILDKYLISHVKTRIFSCYDGTAMSKLPASQKRKLDIEAFRFVVTEVLRLTPEELDSIWSNEVIIHMNLSPLAKSIVATASDELKEATLFNKRLIVLHECFPEYYNCTYPPRYNVMDVINASGTTLKTLSKAGRINTEKISLDYNKDNGKSELEQKNNTGEIVDRITYNALNVYLNTALGTTDKGEHLIALAKPNLLKIKSLGVSKIIRARGRWKSLLDFYYLNSSTETKTMFFEKYRRLRANTQEYDAISAYIDEIEL